MTETPRQYKKRIDEKRKKNEKNRDKLIQQIEKYELVDEDFKTRTKQEILENFEKNQRAEKNSEFYLTVWKELEKIDIKYKELEILKEDLRKRIEEQDSLEIVLKEYEMDASDKTTLLIQMSNFKEMNSKLEKILKEIEELEKKIENREQEIKDIEESYGDKQDTVIPNPWWNQEENSINNDDLLPSAKTANKEPKTLKEYREWTIKNLWRIDHTRHEIIKLLDDWVWIDDDMRNKIKEEISGKFFDYYNDEEQSLSMKAARYQKSRELADLLIDEDLGSVKIWDKTAVVAHNKEWKYCILWLKPKSRYSEWFDKIWYIWEIWGNLVYKVEKDWMQCIFYWEKPYSPWFKLIFDIKEVWWKPVFKAIGTDNVSWVIWWKELLAGEWLAEIWDIWEIWGKPVFMVDSSEDYIVWWTEQCGKFDKVSNPIDIWGKPVFYAKKDWKTWKLWIVWWNELCGNRFDKIWTPINIWDKPAFRAKNEDWKKAIFRGKEQFSDWFDDIWAPINIWGKPAYIAERSWVKTIYRWNERCTYWYDEIWKPIEIWEKPVFKVKNSRDWKEWIYRWIERETGWYAETWKPIEIWEKPAFRAKNEDWKKAIFRGNEQFSDWFDDVWALINIWNKPAFRAKNNDWKKAIFWWNEQLSDWFDDIWSPINIWNKPAFRAKNEDWKKAIFRGNEQFSDWLDNIFKLMNIWDKPTFQTRTNGTYAVVRWEKHKSGYINLLFWWKKSYSYYNNLISDPVKIWDKVIFWIRTYPDVDQDMYDAIILDWKRSEDKMDDSSGIDSNVRDLSQNTLETPRDVREKIIIEWYEKFLNMNELLGFLRKNKIYDDKSIDELEKRVRLNFFKNFDKAKEDKEFQDVDAAYKKLKTMKRQHKKLQEELIWREKEEAEKKDDVDKRMLEISNMAMDLQNASWWDFVKKSKRKKIEKERNELENWQKTFRKLRLENVVLDEDIRKLEEYLGPQKDRSKLRWKSGRKSLDFGDLKQETTLKWYKDKFDQMINNRGKILEGFKDIDYWIDEEIKNEIIEKIGIYIQSLVENKESDEILKEVNKIEEYLSSNLDDIIQKLKELEVKILDKKSQLDEVIEKKKTAQSSDLLKYNEMIYNIKSEEIELEDEYNQMKLMINELLIKYDWSSIDDRLN